jgi:Domain of unknown function (DUF4926)
MSQGSGRRSSSAVPPRRSVEGLALFEVVRLREALPEHQLAGGEEGTVKVLDQPERAFLVEFSWGGNADPADPGLPVVALTAEQLILAWSGQPIGIASTVRRERLMLGYRSGFNTV